MSSTRSTRSARFMARSHFSRASRPESAPPAAAALPPPISCPSRTRETTLSWRPVMTAFAVRPPPVTVTWTWSPWVSGAMPALTLPRESRPRAFSRASGATVAKTWSFMAGSPAMAPMAAARAMPAREPELGMVTPMAFL